MSFLTVARNYAQTNLTQCRDAARTTAHQLGDVARRAYEIRREIAINAMGGIASIPADAQNFTANAAHPRARKNAQLAFTLTLYALSALRRGTIGAKFNNILRDPWSFKLILSLLFYCYHRLGFSLFDNAAMVANISSFPSAAFDIKGYLSIISALAVAYVAGGATTFYYPPPKLLQDAVPKRECPPDIGNPQFSDMIPR